ncbi:sulfurtransferase-like selenium metabolism protein YedF [Slackia heliotrinireducens]|uniref:Predicted redox protein, regulator of disulfide bond formation n=1 Tax=Slackia heliotrinireducens (strain ATCC 29202 / DSM 20476 / NCTC 11029 / RHS 1) TaxID=471855 RepID=C7N2P4_SLAHD|nr:sulfurtransferase-like selenium metabolism protein YedF [Slackia heliotrinireducens]ACV23552.1 predicted redox protein, regulator of disulfide bond formation [Slackia heliotrinireducens DSM 20476]VEH02974.1 selenium metabolism protein YedF [Slackia heliotrinireducens]
MEFTVDAMGEKCPVPVVKAKQAMSTFDEGTLEVLVDNETSVKNLLSFAKSQKCEATSEQLAEEKFSVKIVKTAESVAALAAETAAGGAGIGPRVVVVPSNVMGHGDEELGGVLIKAFIFALTQQDELPETVLFYNGGVKLTCEGSPCLDDLKKLADAGVEIISCGTCLKHYDIEDKLAVGEVSNMYVIVEKQMKAGVVVRA